MQNIKQTTPFSSSTSVFLDILRIFSALVVFISHVIQVFRPEFFYLISAYSHTAVIVFFVLSGHVIFQSANRPGVDWKSYAVARLSKLYSIVFPAILLTCVLDYVGERANPEFYQSLFRGGEGLRYLISVVFLQNIWSMSASPVTNGPLWSLSYEFWYYAILGIVLFVKNRKYKCAILIIVTMIVGLPIIILLPCWLAGLYSSKYIHKFGGLCKWPLVTLSISLLFVLFVTLCFPHIPYHAGVNRKLNYSGAFVSDWTIAFFVACAIGAFNSLTQGVSIVKNGTRNNLIRRIADLTFPLYLFHYPLLVFAYAVMGNNCTVPAIVICVSIGVLASSFAFGYFAEKSRSLYRSLFTILLGKFVILK